MTQLRPIHTFANGVRVYDDHLLPVQRERYASNNVHEAEEEEIFKGMIAAMPPDSIYVDVGAAVGYYCILAWMIRPELRIVAVEALARHRALMRENMGLNGLAEGAFQFVHEAISATPGELEFVDASYGSYLLGPGKNGKNASVEKVQAITLPQLCRSLSQPVGLLQMDIQGEELNVLRHYASEHPDGGTIRQFLIGTHGKELHVACRRILQQMGYAIFADDPKPAHQPDGILAAFKPDAPGR